MFLTREPRQLRGERERSRSERLGRGGTSQSSIGHEISVQEDHVFYHRNVE